RRLSAMIVSVGLKPPDETNTEPSATYTFSSSCMRPQRSTTDVAGSLPIRAVPMMCAVDAGPAYGLPNPPLASASAPTGSQPAAIAPGAAAQISPRRGPKCDEAASSNGWLECVMRGTGNP